MAGNSTGIELAQGKTTVLVKSSESHKKAWLRVWHGPEDAEDIYPAACVSARLARIGFAIVSRTEFHPHHARNWVSHASPARANPGAST
jgi:hypothetical protein